MSLSYRLTRVVGVLGLVAAIGACDMRSPHPEARSARDEPATAEGEIASDGAVFGRIPDVVRDVAPSVVAVVTDKGEGSGVVWDAATVVTNNHVSAGATRIEVAFADGTRSSASLVAADPFTDLAVLRTERDDLPEARFASRLPEVGELAIAIGNPLGFENTASAGIVSGLHRSIPGSAPQTQSLVDLIQTDAPISPGNSGGALVDAEGRVIGINVAYIPPAARAVSIGFAIPSPTVSDVVGQLLEDGSVTHPFFGILPASLTTQIASRLGVDADFGVVVLRVVPDSPADAAGLEAADVITKVDGKSIESVEAFLGALRGQDPSDTVAVHIVRGGDESSVKVTLSARPAAPPG